jgi:endonuclease YncB( thermonuclease family)
MKVKPDSLFEYGAVVARVYDGDSVWLNIDCGFRLWRMYEPIRLYGIDAWEISGEERPAGLVARDALLSRLKLGKVVLIRTIKPSASTVPQAEIADKYGRWLAIVWDEIGNVNDWLVEKGYARSYLP